METIKPLLRGTFHQAMFFIALGACPLLIIKSTTATEYVSTGIYSAAVMMMFGFSTLYHRFNWSAFTKKIMRKLDHVGIFVMIAGTTTPFALVLLPWPDGLILLILIWCVALVGTVQIVYFPNINSYINIAVYVCMSLVILPYLLKMFGLITVTNSVLMIVGIALYIIGAISFGLRFPKLAPKYFGFHEVWHSNVSVAAVLHFIVSYSII